MPNDGGNLLLNEIEKNEFNLNIRRYADTSPPAETFDVKGILVGGVPKYEVSEDYIQELITGVDLKKVFIDKNPKYYSFKSEIKSKEKIRELLTGCSPIAISQFERWWLKYAIPLRGIENECLASEKLMNTYLKELGYES